MSRWEHNKPLMFEKASFVEHSKIWNRHICVRREFMPTKSTIYKHNTVRDPLNKIQDALSYMYKHLW